MRTRRNPSAGRGPAMPAPARILTLAAAAGLALAATVLSGGVAHAWSDCEAGYCPHPHTVHQSNGGREVFDGTGETVYSPDGSSHHLGWGSFQSAPTLAALRAIPAASTPPAATRHAVGVDGCVAVSMYTNASGGVYVIENCNGHEIHRRMN